MLLPLGGKQHPTAGSEAEKIEGPKELGEAAQEFQAIRDTPEGKGGPGRPPEAKLVARLKM